MDESTSAGVEPARARSPTRPAARKLVKWGIVVLAAIVAGILYWAESQHFATTDNAYVNANRIDIAAQVAGPIVAIHVRDQQRVKKDDLLVEIDQRPYQIAVDSAQAQLELAYQTTSQESAAVAAARAQVAQRQAELRNARSNERRVRDLIARKLISQQSAEAMITEAGTAQAAVQVAQINWNELGAHITVFQEALVARESAAQSQMVAMLDAFKLIALSYFFMAPLVLLLRKADRTTQAPAAPME